MPGERARSRSLRNGVGKGSGWVVGSSLTESSTELSLKAPRAASLSRELLLSTVFVFTPIVRVEKHHQPGDSQAIQDSHLQAFLVQVDA